MSNDKRMRRLSQAEKLSFLCGLSEEQAQIIVDQFDRVDLDSIVDLEEINAHSRFDFEELEPLLTDPVALENYRLKINQITKSQLKELLNPDRAEIVLNGRPYYSFEELAEATALPQRILQDLFTIPEMGYEDKSSGKKVTFIPVPGHYIVPGPSELEEEDPVSAAGFIEDKRTSEGFNYRVVSPGGLEAASVVHDLKASYEGSVFPVLRDAQGFDRYFVPGSLDLWFNLENQTGEGGIEQITEEQRLSIISQLGLQVTNAVPDVGYYRVRLSAVPDDRDVTRAVFSAIDRAQDFDEVSFAEIDQVGFEDMEPDESVLPGDDEFEAADRFWNLDAIDLASAHKICKGSPDVIIITVDSGVHMAHEDLIPAFHPEWKTGAMDLNFDLGLPAAEWSPEEKVIAHGTKVAGVVGAQGSSDDVIKIRGIAPDCRILPVKISGRSATPAYGLRAAAILQALKYLKDSQRAVLSLSWRTNGEHIGIREALKEAQSRRVAIVTSAGNYSSGATQRPDEIHYPSAHSYRYPKLTALCSVAAVGYGDRKATYSYYGNNAITFSAPGGEKGGAGMGIYTTSTPDKRVYTRGTSFAAPHVSGLIALLFSLDSNLNPEEAINIIAATVDPIDYLNPVYAGMLGAGRINARAALEAVAPPYATHHIAASASPHGTINPVGEISVAHGADQVFAIAADAGYQIKAVLIDGVKIGTTAHYTFSSVTTSHTIEILFDSLSPDEEKKININQATADELTSLPLIGSWLAERIIAYREAHGPYASRFGLALAGVSPWAIGQMASLITV